MSRFVPSTQRLPMSSVDSPFTSVRGVGMWTRRHRIDQWIIQEAEQINSHNTLPPRLTRQEVCKTEHRTTLRRRVIHEAEQTLSVCDARLARLGKLGKLRH